MNGEINNLFELQCQLQYYVIDADVCIERNYTFNQVVIALYNNIQSITIDVFTPHNLIEDILLINQIYKQL